MILISCKFFRNSLYNPYYPPLEGWELERRHSIERLISVGEKYGIKFALSDEDVVFTNNIYRGRYPAEAGLLPLGEPSRAEAKRAVGLAKRILKDIHTELKIGK